MDRCGVVIAGAGARGAYEAGALSVLIPALETEGLHPSIFVGTSAGAINAAGFGALINYGAAEASRRVLEVWRMIRPHRVYDPVAWGLARQGLGTLRAVAAGRTRPSVGLLDPRPLTALLEAQIPWGQIPENLRHPELLEAVAVAATDEQDHRTRLFVAQDSNRPLPDPDPVRAIDYRLATLGSRHVMASSALPVAFPAVQVEAGGPDPRWYADGGLRLNTPLEPAIALGAQRLVVVATSPMDPSASSPPGGSPGLATGLAQVLHTILADRMGEDLRVLQDKNTWSPTTARTGRPLQTIPFVFTGPADPMAMAELVAEILGPSSARPTVGDRLRGLPGRVLARDLAACEDLSYLFFDPDFIEAAIERGQADARLRLDTRGVIRWQT